MNAVTTRIIGIGQPYAGDDGAGIAVLRVLRHDRRLPAGISLHETTDPARLVALLDGIRHAIVVDALVSAAPPGTVMCVAPEALAADAGAAYSSHGIDVAAAIALARALAAPAAAPRISIVAIAIAPPAGPGDSLSAPVAAALPRAAARILALLSQTPGRTGS